MTDRSARLHRLDHAVLDLDPDRLAAVEAHRIDPYRLARKKPADRQRFKRSLAVPLLFTVDGQTMMGREVVEGGERHDVVGLGEEPAGQAAG
jgi:hypothetical protein